MVSLKVPMQLRLCGRAKLIGGRPWPGPPSNSSIGLRRLVAVDVLIDPAQVRAEVARPGLDRVALLVRRRHHIPALANVGAAGVRVLGLLARVGSLNRVAPVGPGAERDVAQ